MKGSFSREAPRGYHRRIIAISAKDSPNVRYALAEIDAGITPTDTVIVPGVLTWGEYQTRLRTWDPIRQCVGLEGRFYEGSQLWMFPGPWLDRAARRAKTLHEGGVRRQALAIGVDPAEGGDKTAIAVVDELGLLDLVYAQTPDTSAIRRHVAGMMLKYVVPAEKVCFDRGGGGKQIADEMRAIGLEVRTVSFGEPIAREIKQYGGKVMPGEKIEEKEERYTYKTRRSQMFGTLRELLDPDEGGPVDSVKPTWAIPEHLLKDLRGELEPIPLEYGPEGELLLPPKNKRRTNADGTKSKEKTLVELIGHSPDLADAVVLAIYGMQTLEEQVVAGHWGA